MNRNFSKVGWGHPLEAQNVLAVRLKLIQPIFLFELSEGSSLRVLEVLVGERAQLVLGREFRGQDLISFSYPSVSRPPDGSAEQRVQWFRYGIESGGFKQCDMFSRSPVS